MKTREISDKLLSLNQAMAKITEPATVQVLRELLNLIEELVTENEKQKEIIQKQKDEINKFKGEQGKPDIKGNKSNDFSSESERKNAKNQVKKRVSN
jgi:hypothetical protein